MSELFKLLDGTVKRRRSEFDTDSIDRMTRIYDGELPPEFERFFPKSHPKTVVNLVRNAWDDLASDIGRPPDFRAEPFNSSESELERVEKLERIADSYLRHALPTAKQFMFQYAWWLLAGAACAIVRPDYDKMMPIIEIRDPRTAYPGGRKVNNKIVELHDIIFKYEISREEAADMGINTEDDSVRQRYEWQGDEGTNTKIEIIEFIDDTQWVLASDTGTVKRARHNAGVVPACYSQGFSANKSGLSQFQDQVTFMVAISRLISQKLAFGDRLLYPLLWVRGYEGKLNIGPYAVTKLTGEGQMGQINPPTQIQVDQDIQLLERLSRILNKNPAVRQGEVDGKGATVLAKTQDLLAESVDTVKDRYWDEISHALENLVNGAFRMDMALWADEERSISGVKKGTAYRDKYMPSKDIKDRVILAEYGFSQDGHAGFLRSVQAQQAGLMPKRKAIERMPGVNDVEEWMRDIELDQLGDAASAQILAMANAGGLPLPTLAKITKVMAEKGLSLLDATVEVEEMLQAQAAAAAQVGQPGFTTPPAEGGPGQAAPAPALPGLPAYATV